MAHGSAQLNYLNGANGIDALGTPQNYFYRSPHEGPIFDASILRNSVRQLSAGSGL